MGSRVRIAAAACVIASGLFIGGVNATTASAAPTSGAGDDGGTPAGDATGAASTPSRGVVSREASADAPTGSATSPGARAAVVPNATSRVGTSHDVPKYDGSGSVSKQSEEEPQARSQTSGEAAGEPVAAPTRTTTSAAPTVPDQPAAGAEKAEEPNVPREHQTGLGWPWWGPCLDPDAPDDPDEPGLPPVGNGGGNGGAEPVPPRGRPALPPIMHLPRPSGVPPDMPNISVDPAVGTSTGLPTAGAELPFAPITLPAVVAPFGAGPIAGVGGVGGPGVGPRAGMPSAPSTSGAPRNGQPVPKSGRQDPPAFTASNGVPPESFRVGYGNFLRTASVGQMMAIAIPGAAGILFLTAGGGLLGYRQARAGRAVRTNATARFMG